eukprot:TRINITY_DN5990_c0_g1_i1.p1 TRINITY_DN5990_c0_g1~~TRINITY_DN5990_c0_g1_i1.p1  ORF type:complete len:149 (+),score=40.88 TRINITY_DN5990_c0_g1_i1:157-603(+)
MLISSRIRRHFEDLAPKRPRKPTRSDNDLIEEEKQLQEMEIPELKKLQYLNSLQHQMIFRSNADGGFEEFTEADYYRDLNAMDKIHHATGSGFIRVDADQDGSYFRFKSDGQGCLERVPVASNPACNDWISETDMGFGYVSNKPERSG